jgi:hypothetical protein
MSGVHVRSNSDTWTTVTDIYVRNNSDTWTQVTAGYIRDDSDTWVQFWPTSRTYTFSLGNTVHIGTNGYISLDSGQTVDSISSTVDRVLGILPADLELNSIRYAADSSKFYVFFRGKRFGGTNFEIEYEVHFTNGQDYALIKLVAFPSSTYSLTGYYVDGSSSGYSRITATRTVGAEYRVYFGTTAAFATSFTEYGTASHPVWLSQSTLTSGTADQGYISIVANQGSSAQAPTSVTASSITATTVTVSWDAISNANAGMSAIQSYSYSTDGGANWTSTGTSVSASITGLTAGTSYTVLVRANNYFFTGTNYGSVTFTTTATKPPKVPTSPFAYPSASTQITFFWTAPTTDSNHDAATSYDVAWNTTNTTPSSGNTATLGTSINITSGINAGVRYYLFVRGVNADGEGPWTSSVYAKTGTVVITNTGTIVTGTTLSLTISDAEANGLVISKNYQWQKFVSFSWGNISAATTSTYGVVAGDAGFLIRCQVTWSATFNFVTYSQITPSGSILVAAPSVTGLTGTTSNNTNPYVVYNASGTNIASIATIVQYGSTNPPSILSPSSGVSTSAGLSRSVGSRSGSTANFYRMYYLVGYSGGSGTGVASVARQSTTVQRANTVATVNLPVSNF